MIRNESTAPLEEEDPVRHIYSILAELDVE